MLTASQSQLSAPMLKEIENGYDIQSQAIIRNFIEHADEKDNLRRLKLVNTHLQSYLARKRRHDL